MKTIGLIGGVASGKSLVAQLFCELGAGLLDADLAGHFVLSHDPEVKASLIERWGDGILATDGSPDRRQIAAVVFPSNDERAARERQFLESILHPRIQAKLEDQRRALAAAGVPAVVLDAPLLLEAGWASMCDLIVLVDTPREVRLARAVERGWSEAEFSRREAAQWPIEKKRQHADVILPNTGSVDDLRREVRHIWETHIADPASR